MLKKERKKSKVAERFAVAPKRGENHKAPKQDGERPEKVFSLELSVCRSGGGQNFECWILDLARQLR